MLRTCLFPAAGFGTRFLPATKALPKEMLPILTKPLIQYGVEEALAAGMSRIGFVTGRNKRAIEDHFDGNHELEERIRGTEVEGQLHEINALIRRCTFSYTRQVEIKGLGHAILTGETLVGDEPFAVVLADDLCVGGQPPILNRMIQVFEERDCHVLAIEQVPRADTRKYGIVDVTPHGNGVFTVNDLVEKPAPEKAPSNFAIVGRYILKPTIFERLRRTPFGEKGELQITDALKLDLESGPILACLIPGRRFDCGSLDGFVAATQFYYQQLGATP